MAPRVPCSTPAQRQPKCRPKTNPSNPDSTGPRDEYELEEIRAEFEPVPWELSTTLGWVISQSPTDSAKELSMIIGRVTSREPPIDSIDVTPAICPHAATRSESDESMILEARPFHLFLFCRLRY